jgi:hypothetical protein
VLVDDHDAPSHDLPGRLAGITTPPPVPTEHCGLYIGTSESQLLCLIEGMERPVDGGRISRHGPQATDELRHLRPGAPRSAWTPKRELIGDSKLSAGEFEPKGKAAAEARRLHRAQSHCLPFPAGTSKWNKIEHPLFSFISINWRGKPLISHELIIDLTAGTTISTGVKDQVVNP